MIALIAAAAAATSSMSYPPLDAQAYLVCRFPVDGTTGVDQKYDSLALFFPSGVGKDQVEIDDKHTVLGGRQLDFSIKDAKHWSLFAKSGRPVSKEILDFSLTFFPGEHGATYTAAIAANQAVKRLGFCMGLIGPDANKAFERAKSSPDAWDSVK